MAETLHVGPQSWQAVIKAVLAVYADGTPEGKALAESELLSMARVADEVKNLCELLQQILLESEGIESDFDKEIHSQLQRLNQLPEGYIPYWVWKISMNCQSV